MRSERSMRWVLRARGNALASALLAFFAAVAAMVMGACSSHPRSQSGPSNGDGGTSSQGSLRFESDGPLSTTPSQVWPLRVLVTGAAGRLQLGLVGRYEDASLDVAEAEVRDGVASVLLYAPSVATTFSIRARSQNLGDAVLDVVVTAGGVASIRIVPQYAGARLPTEFIASIFYDESCATLAIKPVRDGASPVRIRNGFPEEISDVTAGVHVSVFVRAAHYAMGCKDIDALAAATAREVLVGLIDVPTSFSRNTIDAAFAFEPAPNDAEVWRKLLQASSQLLLDAFLPPTSTDGANLLTAMASLVPADARAQFDATRVAANFDQLAAGWLGRGVPLRTLTASWLDDGRAATAGSLILRIVPVPGTTRATATPQALSPLKVAAGFSLREALTLTVDSQDMFAVGGRLYLLPLGLVAEIGDQHARDLEPLAKDTPSGLAGRIDCKGFGRLLATQAGGESYPGCDGDCTGALCGAALVAAWVQARSSTAPTAQEMVFSFSGNAKATVDDSAMLMSFGEGPVPAGQWTAQVAAPAAQFTMRGSFSGHILAP